MKKIFYHKRFCFFLCGLVLELSVFFKPRINIGNWFGVSSMVSVSLSLCVTSPCAFCPVVHSYSSMRSCAVCCRLLLLPLLSHTWEPQKVFSGGCPEPLAEVFVSDYGVLDALCSRNQTETHERSLFLLRKYSVLISGIQVTAEQPKLGVPCHVTCRSLPFPSSQMHLQAHVLMCSASLSQVCLGRPLWLYRMTWECEDLTKLFHCSLLKGRRGFVIIRKYLVRPKFWPEFWVLFRWCKCFAISAVKTSHVGKKKSISLNFKKYIFWKQNQNTVLGTVFNLNRNFAMILTKKILPGHSTPWSCECGWCSLSWARGKKEYMLPSPSSLPRQCFLPVPVLGCMEQPRNQAHSRNLGATNSHPHIKFGLFWYVFQTH